MEGYRALSDGEIHTMEAAGCSAEAWSAVQVKEGFDPGRVRNAVFMGKVTVSALGGSVSLEGDLPAGIADATLIDCELGDNARVAHSHLARYRVGAGALVSDVGEMVTREGATFGNGVGLEPVNEGGGREMRIFNGMSSQFAYLFCMHRHRGEMVEHLEAMVDAYVEGVTSDRGWVGEGAVVARVPEIVDVNVGPR